MTSVSDATKKLLNFLNNHLHHLHNVSGAQIPSSTLFWLTGEEAVRNQVIKDVAERTEDVVWLEPLELCFLPKSTNLLAAVAVRIESLFVKHRNLSCLKEGDGGNSLFYLLRDIAIGYPGNVDARAHALDPESYAMEVHRAERARITAPTRFPTILDKIADSFPEKSLFILPILDLEFEIPRITEILMMTKLLKSQRFIVIFASDAGIPDLVKDLNRYLPKQQIVEVS